MKKYITIAALLVAGTAFANAESLVTGNAAQVNAYLATELVNYKTGTDFSMEFSLTTVDYSNASQYVLKFSENYELFTQMGQYLGVNDLNYTVGTDVMTGTITGTSTVGTDSVNSVTASLGEGWFVNLGTDGANGTNCLNGTDIKITYTASTKTLVFDFDYSGTTNGSSKGTQKMTFTGASSFDASKLKFNEDKITGVSLTSLTAVPEPSAFGLLAGIGALALVASRRRRK